MRNISFAILLTVALAACGSDTVVLPGDPPWVDATGAGPEIAAPRDAAGGNDASLAPDAGPDRVAPAPSNICRPDADGRITRDEVALLIGASPLYLANAEGTTLPVAPDGVPDPNAPSRRLWDFRDGPRDLAGPLLIEELPPDAWYAAEFPPDVTYVTALGPQTPDLLGVFRLTPTRLEMLGLASRYDGPDHTLLVYDAPVALYRFPLRAPDPAAGPQTWTQTVTFDDAVLAGTRQAGRETYAFTVDQVGTAQLPNFTFSDVLRIRLDLTQTFVFGHDGNTRATTQYFYFTECVGEVARIATPAATPATATEFRRLGM